MTTALYNFARRQGAFVGHPDKDFGSSIKVGPIKVPLTRTDFLAKDHGDGQGRNVVSLTRSGRLVLLLSHMVQREFLRRERARRSTAPPKIAPPPGARVLSILIWVYSKKAVERVFRPAVLDMQTEYIEALADHRPLKARWILMRGYGSITAALLARLPVSLGKLLYQAWRSTS